VSDLAGNKNGKEKGGEFGVGGRGQIPTKREKGDSHEREHVSLREDGGYEPQTKSLGGR